MLYVYVWGPRPYNPNGVTEDMVGGKVGKEVKFVGNHVQIMGSCDEGWTCTTYGLFR